MTQLYEKPKLTVHGRVEELTQNTNPNSADNDFFIFTGPPESSNQGIGGSRDFFRNNDGGGGFQDQN